MTSRRHVCVALSLLVLLWSTPAIAQKVTTKEELTGAGTLRELTGPLGTRPVAEAIALATALEIATTPVAMSSGNFQFRLDPATGLLVRTTATFGPAFAERANTSGEGQVTVGASFMSSTYEKLSGLDLGRMQLGSLTSASPALARTGVANLAINAKTTMISSVIGVTQNLDVGVGVPLVSVKLTGTSTLTNGSGVVARLAEGGGTFSGLGDISAQAKYRFKRFGTELNDTGGIAVLVNSHLPTGSRDNLRGLGITRTLIAGVASGAIGRIRPHVNGGFEYWSKGIQVPVNYATGATEEARHQIQYAAGVEVEASPKLTLMVTFIGRHIQGAGQVGFVTDTTGLPAGITASESAVALGDGIRKIIAAPGLKVNLTGKMLLSVHALATMKNDGLEPKVTPVASLDLTF